MIRTVTEVGKKNLLLLSLVLIGVAYVYSGTLNGPFIYDDIDQIANNHYIHDLSNLRGLFFECLRNTRPLLNLFYAVAWKIAPYKTWAFHLVLILIHVINTALVFFLLRKVFSKSLEKQSILIWVATVMFAFHPLQVQGISYITGATSAIQCLFYLSCLNLYDSEDTKNDWKIWILLAIAMCCKESCILIPAALVWWDLTIGGRTLKSLPYRRYFLLALPILAVVIPLYFYISNPLATHGDSTGFSLYPYREYMIEQGYYYLFYIRLLFDSSSQSLIHPQFEFNNRVVILGILGLLLCSAFIFSAFLLRSKKPAFSFFVGFFFISLLLTNTFFEMINPFAEYRLYQANLALFVGVGFLLNQLLGLVEKPVLKGVVLASLFSWVVWSCVLMQTVWENEASIFVYSLAVYPEAFELHLLLGSYYETNYKWDLAEEQYLEAVPLVKKHHGPISYHPYRLLFRIYVFSKQWKKALNEIDLIEKELGNGLLPEDGYVVYLRLLRKIDDRVNFDKIREKAVGSYPSSVFPKWGDKPKEGLPQNASKSAETTQQKRAP
jgi:hypothetical protein